ncbi:HK97 gp10 family phage protein [Sinirhodobacter ferrireducens]|uniref:HK97 gp10 family phage protein n=1 Tax=Paenirhodobacter ferrireducens TaxID=1215032 RepID=A0A443L6X2_9RHOB|nr:HK97-gp10 family putative phage morphogenesis protein [Sinirhodobacter ferrireducens]RWR44985.1 HK97 gp10 family phage protein [Sinirhodobacter ferrireducens]
MADDLASFQAKLQALGRSASKCVGKAMETSAEEICDLARAACPVDDGDLKKSIGWTWGDAPKGSVSIGTVGDNAAMRITIYAGDAKAYYARWVEFGTKAHAIGKGSNSKLKGKSNQTGAQHNGARARPFFFPAYRLGRKRAINRIKRAISKAVKEAAT